jgi:hypothetical protein
MNARTPQLLRSTDRREARAGQLLHSLRPPRTLTPEAAETVVRLAYVRAARVRAERTTSRLAMACCLIALAVWGVLKARPSPEAASAAGLAPPAPVTQHIDADVAPRPSAWARSSSDWAPARSCPSSMSEASSA